MSYGIQQWGMGAWGGADFTVINHIPIDGATGINRLPAISFTLSTQSGTIILASINLSVNGVALITNGVGTVHATNVSIDNTNPSVVNISATVVHAFDPLEVVNVLVSALNSANQPPISGTTWSFTVDNALSSFTNYIVRGFERIHRVGS